MKKKKKWRHLKRRRNASPTGVAPPRRRPRMPRRGHPPDWRTTLAAVAGGAGGAALGGLVVNQQILSPEAVGLGMIGLGGATAYFADGNTRVVGNSVAAAGAGQLALAIMARKAIAEGKEVARAASKEGAATPLLLGTGQAGDPPSRHKNAGGDGYVAGAFQRTARDLRLLDEDGPEDLPDREPEEVEIYDLVEDAA